MSLRAVNDILINLDTFRNVDLKNQGLYRIKLSIYYKSNETDVRYYAHPYDYSNSLDSEFKSKFSQYLIFPSKIEGDFRYCSKSFIIKYSDEVVDLKEIIRFRCESDFEGELLDQFFIEFILVHADYSKYGGYEYWINSSKNDEEIEFKIISERTFQLVNLFGNSHYYLPIIFENYTYSFCEATAHFSLIDIKFRKNILKYSETDDIMHIVSPPNYIPKIINSTTYSDLQEIIVKEISFFNSNKIDPGAYKQALNKFVYKLACSFEKIRVDCHEIVHNCLFDNKEKLIENKIEIKSLDQYLCEIKNVKYIEKKSLFDSSLNNNIADEKYNDFINILTSKSEKYYSTSLVSPTASSIIMENNKEKKSLENMSKKIEIYNNLKESKESPSNSKQNEEEEKEEKKGIDFILRFSQIQEIGIDKKYEEKDMIKKLEEIDYNANFACQKIIEEMNLLSGSILLIWDTYIKLVTLTSHEIVLNSYTHFANTYSKYLSYFVSNCHINGNDFTYNNFIPKLNENIIKSENIRNSESFLKNFKVEVN